MNTRDHINPQMKPGFPVAVSTFYQNALFFFLDVMRSSLVEHQHRHLRSHHFILLKMSIPCISLCRRFLKKKTTLKLLNRFYVCSTVFLPSEHEVGGGNNNSICRDAFVLLQLFAKPDDITGFLFYTKKLYKLVYLKYSI